MLIDRSPHNGCRRWSHTCGLLAFKGRVLTASEWPSASARGAASDGGVCKQMQALWTMTLGWTTACTVCRIHRPTCIGLHCEARCDLQTPFYLFTHRTDSTDSSCFSFFSGMSVLTLALTVPDWFYGLSDHLMYLFSSTAGFVCTVFERT